MRPLRASVVSAGRISPWFTPTVNDALLFSPFTGQMAVTIYQYRSPIGQFRIQPQRDGGWGLWLKRELLGAYGSCVAAADDVFQQATGDSDWDFLENVDIPTDVYEWKSLTV